MTGRASTLKGSLENGVVCPHYKCNDQTKIAERTANPEKKIRRTSFLLPFAKTSSPPRRTGLKIQKSGFSNGSLRSI
jgi:hypothetical protein